MSGRIEVFRIAYDTGLCEECRERAHRILSVGVGKAHLYALVRVLGQEGLALAIIPAQIPHCECTTMPTGDDDCRSRELHGEGSISAGEAEEMGRIRLIEPERKLYGPDGKVACDPGKVTG